MLDMMDRFMMNLMNDFYEVLKDDLKRFSKNLTDAIEKGDHNDIERYFKMMNSTRDIIKDLEDENLEIKDFVHLLAHKYGLMTDE